MRFLNKEFENSKDKRVQTEERDLQLDTNLKNIQDIFYNINFASNKVFCDLCDKEITKLTKILCAETFSDICFICFANLKETKGFQIGKDYYIINKMDYHLFTQDWTAHEELLLLEGIQKFGFGNWNIISTHIGTKNKDDIKNHYQQVYLDSPNFKPNPDSILTKRKKDMTLVQASPKKKIHLNENNQQMNLELQHEYLNNIDQSQSLNVTNIYSKDQLNMQQQNNHHHLKKQSQQYFQQQQTINQNNNYVQQNQNQSFKQDEIYNSINYEINKKLDNNNEQMQQINIQNLNNKTVVDINNNQLSSQQLKPNIQASPINDILGYYPKRGDFDFEYDCDAELLLAEMEFNENETEQEYEMKLKILDLFNDRLDQRIQRKRFVIEQDLIDFNKQAIKDLIKTTLEKEIGDMLIPIARYYSLSEYNQLEQGLIREKELQDILERLYFYKSLQFKTLNDVMKLIHYKKKQNVDFNKRQSQIDDYVYYNKSSIYNGALKRIRTSRDKNDTKDEYKLKFSPSFNLEEDQLCKDNNLQQNEYMMIKDLILRDCNQYGYLRLKFFENPFRIDQQIIHTIAKFLQKNNQILIQLN